jgi:hypothetical protein
VLAPKNVEKYTASIEQEIDKMVERLIQDGDTDIYSILELNATNIVCSVLIGTTFKSTSDPDFIRMAINIEEGARLAGVDMDIPLFLPILKPLNHILGLEKEMAHFIKVMSEPFVNRLISNAAVSDGPNMIKELKEDRYDFTDREMFLIIRKDILPPLSLKFFTLTCVDGSGSH